MFKKISVSSHSGKGAGEESLQPVPQAGSVLLLAVLVFFLAGCRTAAPLPAVDLQQPGWVTREGQAVWRATYAAPEVAGELLVATRDRDRALAQFTKSPFPLITAQEGPSSWCLEIPAQGRIYAHRGKPPSRVLWFVLNDAVRGKPVRAPWRWTAEEHGTWVLENQRTGERLEGFFTP